MPLLHASATSASAFLIGELGEQSVAVYHGGAVCGKDHVRHAGQRVQQVDSVACRAVGLHSVPTIGGRPAHGPTCTLGSIHGLIE